MILQNAETVRLVGPSPISGPGAAGAPAGAGPDGSRVAARPDVRHAASGGGGDENRSEWVAVAASALTPGDSVFVLRKDEARHTGIAISEEITER